MKEFIDIPSITSCIVIKTSENRYSMISIVVFHRY